MTARQIEGAVTRVGELRALAYEDLGLAALAFALALTASRFHPPFALPLLAGAMTMTFLGMRAYLRRCFLVEDLACEPEAYELVPEVRRVGARAASLEHRRVLARSLRAIVDDSTAERAERVSAVRPELTEIVVALENERISIEPCPAVTLERRLHEFFPLLVDPSVPTDELRSRLRNALAGLGR